MRYVNKAILSHRDDQSNNGSQIDSNQLISASFHVVPGKNDDVGNLKIQASNDLDSGAPPGTFTVTNWVDVPNATVDFTGGTAAIITINQMTFRWLRAVYTRTSGGSSSTLMVVNMMAFSV